MSPVNPESGGNSGSGRKYWRIPPDPGAAEPSAHAAGSDEALSRRGFLGIMGASIAFAGGGGCSRPPSEPIVPYVRTPEVLVPGKPLYFATAIGLDGFSTGVLVESHEGRPTKIEGNPSHPGSGGSTDLFSQASILTLYDPDRARETLERGAVRQYADFVRALRAAVDAERESGGDGVRILSEAVTSPTLAAQRRAILRSLPAARWHQWSPLMPTANAAAGARLAFGRAAHTVHRLDRADVILALDADFLAGTPRCLADVRAFAERRRVAARAEPRMSRLYAVEPSLSLTGAKADHRWPLRARDVLPFAVALARRLGVETAALPAQAPGEIAASALDALARDLAAHRGSSLVVAGDGQPPAVHALAHAMNAVLDNVGKTVVHTEPVATPPDPGDSLEALAEDMRAGRVRVVIVLAWNPVYAAPADLRFGETLERIPFSAYLGLFDDETAVRCRWHVPAAHPLEMWSDARAWDGTTSIVQPLIAPLYNGRSPHEIVALLDQGPAAPTSGYDIVRRYWTTARRDRDFEGFWRRTLHDGVVPDSAARSIDVTLRPGWARSVASDAASPARGLEINFRPSSAVYDGRYANNGWLQELPQPLTSITWDNAAQLSPRTARELGIRSEDVVALDYAGHRVLAPAWITPGHVDGSVTVALGYGRTRAGRVGNGVGFDAYVLQTSQARWFDDGLTVRKVGTTHPLAVAARHHDMEGRDLVVAGTLEAYRRDPNFVRTATENPPRDAGGRPLSLYPDQPGGEYRWGMSIDLGACTACQACVVACYAENNIPVVGREQVRTGRIMHWLRVDTYYSGRPETPEVYHQPVPCMHCEKAPCEVVCPVNATVHSREGLNEMVYNRCVGTRYCSNNCPYKVRVFNFLQYADWETSSLKLQRNPDVTVRSRGVMEKCTYCVQRINAARIEAEKQGRRIRDGEVVPACAAACPGQAIVFGDLNDPASAVRRLKESPLDYALLGELGTRPRTTYLAALRNPHPDAVKT
jgi:molybdopterin-containing oxidoreductase family iron-sulfur binding subunit